jgi:hypothetical protein
MTAPYFQSVQRACNPACNCFVMISQLLTRQGKITAHTVKNAKAQKHWKTERATPRATGVQQRATGVAHTPHTPPCVARTHGRCTPCARGNACGLVGRPHPKARVRHQLGAVMTAAAEGTLIMAHRPSTFRQDVACTRKHLGAPAISSRPDNNLGGFV